MNRTRLRVEALEDRLAPAAGQLDTSFGTNGIVTPVGTNVTKVSSFPDGRYLALVLQGTPSTNVVERFNPDGTLDATYGTGGAVVLADSLGAAGSSPSTLTALPNGGALIGWGVVGNVKVVRLTATGAVDASFGNAGPLFPYSGTSIPIPNATVSSYLTDIEVQADGRVLVAGAKSSTPIVRGQSAFYQGFVIRLTTDGKIDDTFAAGDIVSQTVGSVSGGHVAVQSDGKVLYTGSGSVTTAGTLILRYAALAVRLNADGTLDPTFGTGGFALIDPPQVTFSDFSSVHVLPDGGVVLGGRANLTSPANVPVGLAARLTAGGQPDASYGSGGTVLSPAFTTRSGGAASSILSAIDGFGRVVFGAPGVLQNGNLDTTLYRLTASGVADAKFGAEGQVLINGLPGLSNIGPDNLNLPGLFAQPDGSIVVSGNTSATSGTSGLMARILGFTPPVGFVPTATGAITAGGPADGTFQVLNRTDGAYSAAGTIAGDAGASVRTATGDVNGDGTPDYITGAGPGGAPRVRVIDGKTGNTLADYLVFEAGFTGGVFVAAMDLDRDGRAEIVVTPDRGGGPRVVVLSVAGGGAVTPVASFLGIEDASFRGGARAAAGDVNADGTPDLIVAAGYEGGPRVAVFNGRTVTGTPARLVHDFFAFPGSDAVNLRNGAFVAAGDVDGDGFADLIFGGGYGGAPRVLILSGAAVLTGDVAAAQANPITNFYVNGNTADRGGVTVAAAAVAGGVTVAVGSGQGSAGRVRVYQGTDFTTAGEPTTFQDIAVFGGATVPGGVFVG